MLRARNMADARRRGLVPAVSQRVPQFELTLSEPVPAAGVDVRKIVGQEVSNSTRRLLLSNMALPMPPSMNDYWRSRIIIPKDEGKEPFVTVYTTSQAKEYQERLRALMLERKYWHKSPHPVRMKVLLCFRHDRGQDLDNRIKPLQDALVAANVLENDRQVRQFEARLGPLLNPAVCFVTLEEFLPARDANLEWIKHRD